MLAPPPPDAASLAGDVAVSGAAFWSLLAGVLALAVAAQYAVIVAGGARGAAHYAHDAWLAARSSASHYVHDARDSAASVMHGAPHWAWASADTSHPAEALRRARSGFLRARAWPWNWLRADTRYYDAPHGAGDTLFTRIFYRKRPACAPPLKCACPRRHACMRALLACKPARAPPRAARTGAARAMRRAACFFRCFPPAACGSEAATRAQTATGRAWRRRTCATAPARPGCGRVRT